MPSSRRRSRRIARQREGGDDDAPGGGDDDAPGGGSRSSSTERRWRTTADAPPTCGGGRDRGDHRAHREAEGRRRRRRLHDACVYEKMGRWPKHPVASAIILYYNIMQQSQHAKHMFGRAQSFILKYYLGLASCIDSYVIGLFFAPPVKTIFSKVVIYEIKVY